MTTRNILLLALAALCREGSAATHARFDLATTAAGPFPSDKFAIAEPSHITGLRINLPLPDCEERPSDCADLQVVNELDGFNIQPRLSIPFDGPIDPKSATSRTVFLVQLGSTENPPMVGINQIFGTRRPIRYTPNPTTCSTSTHAMP